MCIKDQVKRVLQYDSIYTYKTWMMYVKAGLRMLGGGQKRGNIPTLLACRNVKYEKIDRNTG